MAMTITYELDGSLYVNVTNRCCNDCIFCLRNNHDSVNGEDVLWLDHEPTVEEIKEDFRKRNMSNYKQVVFCGYGEPLMRFDTCITTAKWIKETYPFIKIRINTNGLANMMEKRDVTPKFQGIIDSISISLNASTPERYDELCKSCFGLDAFDGLLDFAQKAKAFVPEVTLSVVDHDISAEEIESCRLLVESRDLGFRVREYIK